MKSTAGAILALSWLLAGASCQERKDPPVPVVTKVAVPVPCKVPEPVCQDPAYNGAQKGMEGDLKLKLLRAEVVAYEDCLRQYRLALKDCR